jgi:tRNA(His) guanylyltransferase
MNSQIKAQETLGDKMKAAEAVYRSVIPAKTYAVIRLDGKAFHTYTRGLARPYDLSFMADMDTVSVQMCKLLSTARFAYVQSDEISVLLTDWSKDKDTQQFYGGQVQKIVSVAASTASAVLNTIRPPKDLSHVGAFDARIFTLDTADEVRDYFSWRQQDAIKNSVSMAASTHFSPRQLSGVNTSDRRAMLESINQPWDSLPDGFRFGRVVKKETYLATTSFVDGRTKRESTVEAMRSRWVAEPAGSFKRDNDYTESLIPQRDY